MGNVDSGTATQSSRVSRLVTVAEFPVVQHRHPDGAIVTVRLRRVEGEYRTVCAGCDTEFLYRKPRLSQMVHHKSPLLPEIKGDFDDPEHDFS